MDSVGEGEGRKIWENGIERCKISCMKKKSFDCKNRQVGLPQTKKLLHVKGIHLQNEKSTYFI